MSRYFIGLKASLFLISFLFFGFINNENVNILNQNFPFAKTLLNGNTILICNDGIYYLDTTYSYRYTTDNLCAQIILNYNETADNIDLTKNNFDNAVNKIIKGANQYKSNYEKEKYVHDYLVKNTEYDLNSRLNQSAYSALVYKESVCSGYARSFQYIMNELKIPTYYVTGSSSEGPHAWNIISLSDGFYNVDLTFDDTTMSHKYFNLSSNEFNKNHTRLDLSLKLPDAYGSKFLGYRKVKGYASDNNTLDES